MAMESSSKASDSAKKTISKDMKKLLKELDGDGALPEEKLSVLRTRYLSSASDIQKLELANQKHQATNEALAKENDRMKVELIQSQSKLKRLEELSRLLQQQKNDIEAASKLRSQEDRERLQSSQEKMSEAIQNIQVKIDKEAADRESVLQENNELRSKIGEAVKSFSTYEELIQAKDEQYMAVKGQLEAQLAHEKDVLKNMEIISEANQNLKQELISRAEHISLLTQLNDGLKNQLSMQTKSYKELEAAVGSVKKQIKDSGKKHTELSNRLAKSDSLCITLSEENQAIKQEMRKLQTQKETLESLCRELAAKRGTPTPTDLPSSQETQEAHV